VLEHSDAPGAWVVKLENRRDVLHGDIVERLGQAVHRGAPDVMRAQKLQPLRGRSLAEERVERLPNLVALREGDRRIHKGRQRSGVTEHLAERADRSHRDGEVAVRCRIEAIRH
jgi:hypothetical protein